MEQERKASLAADGAKPSNLARTRMGSAKRWGFLAAALLLFPGFAALHCLTGANGAPEPAEPPPIPAMFQGWAKPDFVLFLTGQTQGYLQPCGCSQPQYGGIVRRYNFMESLKAKGWNIVPIDLGEIIAPKGMYEAQTRLKYAVNMEALERMGYAAYGIGESELKMDLVRTLAGFTAQQKQAQPVPVSLNIKNTAQKGQLFFDLGVRQYVVVTTPSAKIGITSIVSPDTEAAAKGDPNVAFENNGKILPPGLVGMKRDKAEFVVLLYQGSEKAAKLAALFANNLAKKDPKTAPVHLVVHPAEEEEPPAGFVQAEEAELLTLGHKGRYVGVVGVWRKPGGGFDTKYQLVSMGPEWATPAAKEKDHPIMKLMETKFAKAIADQKLAEQFPRNEHATQLEMKAIGGSATYVGSERCGDCHDHAYKVWIKQNQEKGGPAHHDAFETLVNAKKPGLRDRDGECIVCHTVGYLHEGGYLDPGNKTKKNERLKGVGCESCHGPGSMHADDPNNKNYYKLINAFAPQHNPGLPTKIRMQRLDAFCQKCHDIDNDVHWGKIPFEKKWEMIAHPTPKKGNQAANSEPGKLDPKVDP